MTTDLLTPYRWLLQSDGPLGDIYCVSFFRGLRPVEVLHRFGGPGEPSTREMTFEELEEEVLEFVHGSDGGLGGGYVGVVEAGAWSVAVELWGWYASLVETAPRLSQGCEMVAVSRHDYAEDGFTYAVGGAVVSAFTPNRSYDRFGNDPRRLDDLMRRAGLALAEPDDDADWDDAVEHGLARTFVLAAEITGVPMSPALLNRPLLVGPVADAHT
ncbi:hypothetical protein EDD27_6326 [Nonomuraea polychroma]|uniref:Uncharacterized protein n=1 Tax=Nonomuraea polychroma TaxID=46176 RepID=A0A438MCV4_9ACTN|nr:DUF6461 domain-containing protein [Nonomuraea polychroma]RVX43633.1 hypothetical protein EDD27_6326 [Nonomuraea polychroma]